MSKENNTEEKGTKLNGGMVFYPRKYILNESDIEKSRAYGLNEKNEECIVYIFPDERSKINAENSKTGQTVPSIYEFADNDLSLARTPCLASEDNSKDNSCGVFLLEQVTRRDDLDRYHKGYPVYIGKWASILKKDKSAADPSVGYGYLEVNSQNKLDEELAEYYDRYKQLLSEKNNPNNPDQLKTDEELLDCWRSIISGKKKWYTAVNIKVEEISSYNSRDITESLLREFMINVFEKYTKEGKYAGVLVRVRDDKKVLSKFCSSAESNFNFKTGSITDFNETFSNYMKWNGNFLFKVIKNKPNLTIDLIPTERINSNKSNEKFNDDISSGYETSKVMKTYISSLFHSNPVCDYKKEKAFLFSKIATRNSKIRRGRDKGNILLSSMHAYTAPLGNAFSVNSKGGPEFYMDFEEELRKSK